MEFNLGLFASSLRLNSEFEPLNPFEFSKALDKIISKLALGHIIIDHPTDDRVIKKLKIAKVLYLAKVTTEIKNKCETIFNALFQNQPPVILSVGKKNIFLFENIQCIENTTFGDFFNVESAKNIQKSTYAVSLKELIGQEVLVDPINNLTDSTPLTKKELIDLLTFLENGKNDLPNYITACRMINLAKFYKIESLFQHCIFPLEFRANLNITWKALTNFPLTSKFFPSFLKLIFIKPIDEITDVKLLSAIDEIKKEIPLCFSFEKDFIEFEIFKDFKDEDTQEIERLLSIYGNDIFKNFSELFAFLCIKLKKLNADNLDIVIDLLSKTPAISKLHFEGDDCSMDMTHQLFEKVKTVKFLCISANGVMKNIPEIVLKQINFLRVHTCHSLCTLNTFDIEDVRVSYCYNMTSIVGKGKNLRAEDLASLNEIEFHNALKIQISICDNLSILLARNLKSCSLHQVSIQKLHFPNIQQLSISRCRHIKLIESPKLEELYASRLHPEIVIKCPESTKKLSLELAPDDF